MLSCWHDLLFLFLSPTILYSSSFHGLVECGCGLWTDRVFSLSPSLAQRTPNNNNNNNNNKVHSKEVHGTGYNFLASRVYCQITNYEVKSISFK